MPRLRLFLALAMFVTALVYDARQGMEWARQEATSPLFRFVEQAKDAIPPDGRVLLVVPKKKVTADHLRASAWLYPRVVYPLPEGTSTLEEAAAWAEGKGLRWAVFIGEERYDPGRACVRRLDGDR